LFYIVYTDRDTHSEREEEPNSNAKMCRFKCFRGSSLNYRPIFLVFYGVHLAATLRENMIFRRQGRRAKKPFFDSLLTESENCSKPVSIRADCTRGYCKMQTRPKTFRIVALFPHFRLGRTWHHSASTNHHYRTRNERAARALLSES
jgi:hypothetical protein